MGIDTLGKKEKLNTFEKLMRASDTRRYHIGYDQGFADGLRHRENEARRRKKERSKDNRFQHGNPAWHGKTIQQAFAMQLQERKAQDTWDRASESREQYARRMKEVAIDLAKGLFKPKPEKEYEF